MLHSMNALSPYGASYLTELQKAAALQPSPSSWTPPLLTQLSAETHWADEVY